MMEGRRAVAVFPMRHQQQRAPAVQQQVLRQIADHAGRVVVRIGDYKQDSYFGEGMGAGSLHLLRREKEF